MEEFSIIIPTHNQTQLLQRCVDSIPDREDIQVIIVDDNSVPLVLEFEREIESKRKNVEIVYTTVGLGGGYARNVGMAKARGKWLVFVDSDDELLTSQFEEAIDQYYTSEADIVFFDAEVVDSESGQLVDKTIPYQKIIRSVSPDVENMCRYKLLVPWGKLIKRSLVIDNNIHFDETRVANDAMFSLLTGYYAKEVLIDSRPIYRWYMGNSGSITSFHDKDAVTIHVDCAIRRNKFFYSHQLGIYRNNMFFFFPMMRRSGFSYLEAMKSTIKGEKIRYMIIDCIAVALTYFKYKSDGNQ